MQTNNELQIINTLMYRASILADIGLLHGKMGIALFFYHWAKQKKNTQYSDFASGLIDQIATAITIKTPINFSDGFTGIGWGIEYLTQNKFIECNTDEILEEFDNRVKYELIHSENTLSTLISMGYYLVSRLCYRINDEKNEPALDLKYIAILLIDNIENQILAGSYSAELPHLLKELHRLSIFNYKVEKLQKNMKYPAINYRFPYIPCLSPEEIDTKLHTVKISSLYNAPSIETDLWGIQNGISGILLQKILLEK